jgi:hypothetical protein
MNSPSSPDEPLRFGGEADDEITGEEEREAIRRLSRRSIYFLGKAILGVNIANPRTHKAYCEFVEDDTHKRVLTLMPRGTLKTTLGTEIDCVRLLAKNPNERILLGSSTVKNARAMLRTIKGYFTGNERFRFLFPEIIHPDFNAKGLIWNQDEIQVPRTANWPEPSIMCVGVGAEVVSRHFTRFKFDDLIGRSAMDSPAIMEDAINWLTYSTSLVADQRDYRIHLNGTRYGMEDLYQYAIDKMGFEVFVRKAIVINPKTGEPEPFFPEKHSLEFLEEVIRTDPFQYATQYANDPYDTTDTDLDPSWLQYYTIAPDGDIRYTEEDGSLTKQNINSLTTYIHCDPGGEGKKQDKNAIIVVGVNHKGYVFVLASELFHGDALVFIDKIFALDARFSSKLVSIEAVAYQRHIKYFMEQRMKRENRYIRIENHQPGSRQNKHTRIRRRLQPYFSTGTVFTRASFADFITEYTHFSDRSHPHLLDALAQGPEYWKTPLAPDVLRKINKLASSTPSNRGRSGYGI